MAPPAVRSFLTIALLLLSVGHRDRPKLAACMGAAICLFSTVALGFLATVWALGARRSGAKRARISMTSFT